MGKSALIVDDSRTSRRMMSDILRALGFEVVEAEDGLQGIELMALRGAFDVALVDWNMPQMDGLAFVRAVRADDRFLRMQIMMVTTEHDLPRVVQALDAGAHEYLMKPFTSEMVVEKLALLGLSSQTP